jgi:hypothetical protein
MPVMMFDSSVNLSCIGDRLVTIGAIDHLERAAELSIGRNIELLVDRSVIGVDYPVSHFCVDCRPDAVMMWVKWSRCFVGMARLCRRDRLKLSGHPASCNRRCQNVRRYTEQAFSTRPRRQDLSSGSPMET